MKVSISLPDGLVLDTKVNNRSGLIELLLQQWRKQQQVQEMAKACLLLDDQPLGWDKECELAAITDWEASG